MPGEVALFLIIMVLSFFGSIFGIYYLKTRQNLSMIEKGMNPKEFADRPAPYKNLKWALLLVGAGLGLFVAYFLDNYLLNPNQHFHDHDGSVAAIYFSLIAVGGGLGLFGSYKMEKKWWDENKPKS